MSNLLDPPEPISPRLKITVDIRDALHVGTPDAIASAANPERSPRAVGDVSKGLLACHAHFVGPDVPRKIESFYLSESSPSSSFELSVPLGSRAVCLTIVQRFRDGWLRHSRVRINFYEFEETTPVKKNLKDEQLRKGEVSADGTISREYGTVTAERVGRLPTALSEVVMFREWFDVPEATEQRLRQIQNQCSSWYKNMQPTSGLTSRVHMPHWNNQDGSIPGAFFAFSSRREETRYRKEDFESAFEAAQPLVDGTILLNPRRPLGVEEWLTTALMIFGKSIQYQGDRTVFSSTIVERFSSTARLDGLGDCEDIAKETAMAHADLVAIARSWDKDISSISLAACSIAKKAIEHECIMTLCTVRRDDSSVIEAHAFALVVPKDFIEGKRGGPRHSFIADGTYPCDPTAANEPGPRPWRYEHFVSALVYGRGELFFKYEGTREYGVKADDVFPEIRETVTVEWVYRCDAKEERRWIESILEANVPTTTRTFGREKESVRERFERLTFVEGKLFPGSFGYMPTDGRRRIEKMSRGFQAPCAFPETFSSLTNDTKLRVETAGYFDPWGRAMDRKIGTHGAVGAVENRKHVYHTHHRPEGREAFFSHNIPTPDDVAIFIASRVCSHLRDDSELVTTSTVWTHNNVYEISDTNDAGGLVTRLWFKYKREKSSDPSVDDVFVKAFPEVKKAVARWVKYERGGPKLIVELREDNATEREAYLDSFEKLGIRISRMDATTYGRTCKN